MTMQLQFIFLVFLSAISLMTSSQSFAVEKHTLCSDKEIQQINQKYSLKLKPEPIPDDEKNTFNNYACIKIKPENKIIFAYISNGSSDSYKNQDYNLSMLVLDAHQKLLNRFHQKDFIEFSGLEFEGIRLENVPFSTLKNTTVFGLSSTERKLGDPGISNHSLNLFQISSSGKIQRILYQFPFYIYSSLSRRQCHDATTDLIERKLILTDQLSHGLQNIIVKETKTVHGSEYKTCKSSENKYKRQHIMKFDGVKYIFNEAFFLQSDGI
ncbi:hypothetical protein QR674_07350 [Acinetobacter chinensis]|uniref:RND transporter n=1 Tax=Acinetobacter chinensis TaxID=2004650 RepID=A0ABU3WEE3_9GAMM|nr:hypothetical protein [Acinetobacter chinensis]MDV2468796.1 hypothetical protein [Acinetobacter chinensis]